MGAAGFEPERHAARVVGGERHDVLDLRCRDLGLPGDGRDELRRGDARRRRGEDTGAAVAEQERPVGLAVEDQPARGSFVAGLDNPEARLRQTRAEPPGRSGRADDPDRKAVRLGVVARDE